MQMATCCLQLITRRKHGLAYIHLRKLFRKLSVVGLCCILCVCARAALVHLTVDERTFQESTCIGRLLLMLLETPAGMRSSCM